MVALLYSLAVLLSSLELLAWARPGLLDLGRVVDLNETGVVVSDGHVEDVDSANIKTGPFADDCVEYCSLSYPPHTYPQVFNSELYLQDRPQSSH